MMSLLRASIISLTFSIARVEYVTLWLVVGVGPAGISKGNSPDGADTTSKTPPSVGAGVATRGGGVDVRGRSGWLVDTPFIATDGVSPSGAPIMEASGVTGGDNGRLPSCGASDLKSLLVSL